MRRLPIVLACVLIVLSTPLLLPNPSAAQYPTATPTITTTPIPCPDAQPTRLAGELQAVAMVDNVPANFEPSLKSFKVATIKLFELVYINGFPTCADNAIWYRIYAANGFGWIMEADSTQYNFAPLTSITVLNQSISTPQSAPFNYDGITFTENAAIGVPIKVVTYYPVRKSVEFPQLADEPGHIELDFAQPGYPSTALAVYPTHAPRQIQSDIGRKVVTVKSLTSQQPKLGPEGIPMSGQARFSLLAYPTLGNVVNLQYKYLKFQNGVAIRFLTLMGCQNGPPCHLYYESEGITADGEHFITFAIEMRNWDAALPQPIVTVTPSCPGIPYCILDKPVAIALNQAPPSDFQPNLDDLDAFFSSIMVTNQ
jgi:hypothetical protein